MLGAPGADETTFAAVYLVAALAWAPAFYRAIDPRLRRRVGILLGVTIVWRRGWTADPRVPVGDTLERIVHRLGVLTHLLGGMWPVTILVAATLALSLPAQLAVTLALATIAIWVLFRAGGSRLASSA